jgi:hypothetical protein
LITADPETKILIESSKFFFPNIEVASQHPDAFVINSIPERQSIPVLPLEGPLDSLKKKGVNLLVFQGEEYKNLLNRSPGVVKVRDFGPWSIYALTQWQAHFVGGVSSRFTYRLNAPW